MSSGLLSTLLLGAACTIAVLGYYLHEDTACFFDAAFTGYAVGVLSSLSSTVRSRSEDD